MPYLQYNDDDDDYDDYWHSDYENKWEFLNLTHYDQCIQSIADNNEAIKHYNRLELERYTKLDESVTYSAYSCSCKSANI